MTRIKKEIKKVQAEFFKTVSTLVVSAFGLVAALAWNKAITEIINQYIQPDEGILSWIVYAVAVTIFAVLITLYVGRLAKRFDEGKKGD